MLKTKYYKCKCGWRGRYTLPKYTDKGKVERLCPRCKNKVVRDLD